MEGTPYVRTNSIILLSGKMFAEFLSPFLCMYPRASVQSENEKKLYRKAS